MPRHVPLMVGWTTLLVVELVLATRGFHRHLPAQVLLEVAAILVIGASHAHFSRTEGRWAWLSSPLWLAAAPIALSGFLAAAPEGAGKVVFLVGSVTVAAGTVRCLDLVLARLGLLRSQGVRLGLAVLAAVVGGLGVRVAVLSGVEAGHGSALERLARDLPQLLSAPSAPTSDGPPVVLVTVDTLRADHAVRMATWTRLANRGATWARAMSTSSWTVPAMGSAHTGLLPSEHGAGLSPDGRPQGLVPDVRTVATTYREAGYTTAAVATNAWLLPWLGFDRGFDVYLHPDDDFPHYLLGAGFPRRARPHEGEEVVDRALRWLDGAPERGWFLWVHLVDPHLPYVHATDPQDLALSDERLRNGQWLLPDLPERVREAYQGEVEYTDEQLARLLDALEARGVLDEGLVVFTADHGEELWDHGGTGHGHQHHGEVVDVALAVVAPGVAPGERRTLASLQDVGTTLGAFVGAPLGDGYDLRRELPPDRVAVAWGNAYFEPASSARRGNGRVLVDADGNPRCFDLGADPLERRPASCEAFEDLVHEAQRVTGPAAAAAADVPVEALEALGYVVP